MVWNVFFNPGKSFEWYEGRISSRFILDGIRSPIPLVILGSVFFMFKTNSPCKIQRSVSLV